MITVTLVAYRADSEYDTEGRVESVETLDERVPLGGDVVNRKALSDEEGVVLLVAVGYEHACGFETVDDGCAEGDDEHIGTAKKVENRRLGGVDGLEERVTSVGREA